ncbi:MAG: DNA replication complex subunit Gins51 [Candidatus Thorarchaeota archaeon]
MSEIVYDDIKKTWEDEKNNDSLQNLEDLRLSKMVAYLSTVRHLLAETPSENSVQVDLMTQEGLNIEFMLRDLFMLRRTKIMNAVLSQVKPAGSMTLAEEEFYNRVSRGVTSHSEFVEEVLAGTPVPTMKRSKKKKKESPPPVKKKKAEEVDEMEYVMVRFLRSVEEPFMGLDEVVYGPFQEEDIATIPTANAKSWLRDGTVTRIVPSNAEDD